MDKIHSALNSLDKELSKHEIALAFERKTNIPKAYVAAGLGSLLLLIVSFNICGYAPLLTNLFGISLAFCSSYGTMRGVAPSASAVAQWMSYWMVFGVISTLEFFKGLILEFIPLYFLLKCVLFMWLALPKYQVFYHIIIISLIVSLGCNCCF